MPSDLRDLLETTAAVPTRGPDLAGISARVRRRRRARRAGLAALAVTAVLGAGLGVERLGDGSGPDVRVTTDSTTGTAAPTTTAAPAATVGPVLDPAALGDLPGEGVALGLDGRVVLVGLDGTVLGHVRGTFDAGPSNLVPVLAADAGNRPVWLDPARGTAQDMLGMGTPLWSGLRLLYDPDSSARLVLEGTTGPIETLASWPDDVPWWLSADHRVLTWATCADGRCPWRYFDSATRFEGSVPPGCWVASAPGEATQTHLCDDGSRILTVAPGGGGDVSVGEATGGGAARLVFDDLVRVEGPRGDGGCPAIGAYRLRGDRLDAVLGPDATTVVPLGVAGDGRAVVHLPGGCPTTASPPGVHLVDAGGALTPVWLGDLPVDAARMWTTLPVALAGLD